MEKKELTALTDQELLQESKKLKATGTTNALLIGFLIGILAYSIWMNSLGFLSLIPLALIFALVNKSKYKRQELDQELATRKLK